jgi:hypothetical protein
VLVLFFILAMVAAYTNRNLIFEQRTSANSYRSARALAAADAGIDWAVAMLNGGAIDEHCEPSSAPADNDFKTRYLTLLPDGSFSGEKPAGRIQPACSATAAGNWSCSCVKDGPPAKLDSANSDTPVFAVSIAPPLGQRPGALGIKVRGCHVVRAGVVDSTNVNSFGSCHFNDLSANDATVKAAVTADAVAIVRVSLGLVSALPVVPTAAMTARGKIEQTGGSILSVANPDPATGLALMAGGTITSALNVAGPAGLASATADLVAPNNVGLTSIAPTDFFRTALGLPEDQYKQQPGAVKCESGCADLATLSAKNPTRVIFVDGDLTLNSASLGSSEAPVMLVVKGKVTISGSTTLKGIIFAGGDLDWNGANSSVFGAVIVGGNYSGTANASIAYDRGIVRQVHKSYGSFVRIPGSWNTEF